MLAGPTIFLAMAGNGLPWPSGGLNHAGLQTHGQIHASVPAGFFRGMGWHAKHGAMVRWFFLEARPRTISEAPPVM